jgi:hypothetical protein
MVTMLASVHTLLEHAIDYAGLFPPAALGLGDALSDYVAALRSPESWLLNRFVIRLDHLADFERLFEPMASDHRGAPLALSVIVPAAAASPFERVQDFNERWSGYAQAASIEFAPLPAARIPALAEVAPEGVELFFETSVDTDLADRLREVKAGDGGAKVRTGGVTPDAILPTDALVRFLHTAHEIDVRFKATAGLHHALRGVYPLTYDSNAASATMHGFLNLAAAAANVRAGGAPDQTAAMLLESSTDAFEFRPDGLRWHGQTINCEALADSRRFFRSFGSCSIREAVDELRRLRLL